MMTSWFISAPSTTVAPGCGKNSPSRHGLSEKGCDFVHCFIAKVQFAGAHDPFGLTRVAGTDNGSGDGRIVQRPGDCYFADRSVVASCELPQPLNQRQVTREIWLGEVGMILAPIVVG